MRTNEKREHWERILAAWQDSGQTQRAFCEEQGLSYANFCYWRKGSGVGSIGLGDDNEDLRAVEITGLSCGFHVKDFPAAPSIEMETQGIILSIPGCDATVTIAGRVSLGVLGRIMAACEGITDHAQAR
jgi:hypothetical protein